MVFFVDAPFSTDAPLDLPYDPFEWSPETGLICLHDAVAVKQQRDTFF
jgi:hypothetical protein